MNLGKSNLEHNDLVINSGEISRVHAKIVKESGTFYLQDQGSLNGTYVVSKSIPIEQYRIIVVENIQFSFFNFDK